jgi:flagellum-specific peptidoglycan hydrolase FlgJ
MDRCGVKISAGSANQKNNGTGVDASQAQAGDLVVWKGHVGLVIDSNKNMIDAGSGSVPKIRSYETDYWRSRGAYSIRRVIDPNQMVSAKVDNYHTGIGFSGVVGSQGGQDLNGGGTTNPTDGTGTTATATAAPALDQMGVFGKLANVGNTMITALYNDKTYAEAEAMMNPVISSPTTGGENPSTGTNPDISGITDSAKATWTFFTGKGYSDHATAGIMGNLKQESGLDPTKKQYGGGPGRGIAQWTVGSGRFKGLEAHAKSKGKDWTDLQSQLEWIDLELNGKDSTTLSKLNKSYGGIEGFKKASDTKWAVEAFEKSFERAGKPNYANRYKYANEYYSSLASAGMGFTMATAADPTGDAGSSPESMNGWAYYRQGDPKWQEDINGKKIGPSGCGMASHAMLLTTAFGKKVTPVTVGKWARANGHWSSGMGWNMPSSLASKVGMKIVATKTADGGLPDSEYDNVVSQIKSGHPVVLSGRSDSSSNYNSPFTSGGHIVLAVGVDGSGNLIINDPRGPHRTKAYTKSGVMNAGTGMRGYWAFDMTSNAKLPEDWIGGDYTGTPGTGGGATPTDGTATAAPAIDQMGVFGKLANVGNTTITALYNDKTYAEAESAMNSVGTTPGTTTPGGTLPVGNTNVDETLMLSGQEGFFKALGPSAAAAYNEYHIFPSTTLAQAALESAWGKSRVAKSDKNLFGIKWTGKCAPSITVEKGLNCPGNEQGGARPYNRYKSYSDSMTDHGWFLGKNRKRYGPTLDAATPEQQIKELGKSGYAEASTYASSLQNMINKYNLTKYNTASNSSSTPSGNAGSGDGKTYMVQPTKYKSAVVRPDKKQSMIDKNIRNYDYKLTKEYDDVIKHPERQTYSKPISYRTGNNVINVDIQRDLENINRRIDRSFNNLTNPDPNAYAEILKLIMEELKAINSNTAATASGVSEIQIVSSNEPVSKVQEYPSTAERYKNSKVSRSTLQQVNTNTGYDIARQIAGYKK